MFDEDDTLDERVGKVFLTLHTLQEGYFASSEQWGEDDDDESVYQANVAREAGAALGVALHLIRAALNYGE